MQRNKAMVPKIIWGALLFSHLIFVAISYLGIIKGSEEPIESYMKYVLYGVAGFNALLSFIIYSKAKTKKKFEEFFVLFIMSSAFAESINIFGVVAQVLGLTFGEYLNFALTGIVLHIFYFPKEIPAE